MKKFKFTLTTFLRTKEIQESQTKKKLAEIIQELQKAMDMLELIEYETEKMQQQCLEVMSEGTNSDSLNQYANCISSLKQQHKNQKIITEKIEKEKSACQEELSKIMGEIKGLQKIKQKQYEEFLYECAKEQELEIEEFVLFQTK